MAGMTREQWTVAGLEIAEHLKALQRIAAKNGINQLSISVSGSKDKPIWATYIEDQAEETGTQYEVDIYKNKLSMSVDQKTYHTRT